MRNIKLTLSYDGSCFLGWQKNNAGPSIEEALEKALFQLLGSFISLQAASRTDAGVHALGQVVNFHLKDDSIDVKKLHRSINAVIDKGISVLSLEEEEEHFHPTIDNEGKEYHYFICNTPYQIPFHKKYSWHFCHDIDTDLMQKAALLLTGYRDFSAFCNDRSQFTRSAFCRIDSIQIIPLEGGRIQCKIKGTRFLYKMVRNIVGTLAYVGSGKIPIEALSRIISSHQRATAGITAPAHGLFLKEVFYPQKKLINAQEISIGAL